MSKKSISGIPAAALALLAATSYGLLLPSPAFASHTCIHYVVVMCQNWQQLDYSSQAECYEMESMQCSQRAVEASAKPASAIRDRKLPRRAVVTAPGEPPNPGAPPARSLPLGAN